MFWFLYIGLHLGLLIKSLSDHQLDVGEFWNSVHSMPTLLGVGEVIYLAILSVSVVITSFIDKAINLGPTCACVLLVDVAFK